MTMARASTARWMAGTSKLPWITAQKSAPCMA
jgi:hypothetical protein